MRVVLDTNVILSNFISRVGAPAVIRRLEQGEFEFLVTPEILAEYERALNYPRIRARHRMDGNDVAAAVRRLEELATHLVPPHLTTPVAVDPDDDKFLACAVAGSADYIVSGDQHLLVLRQYRAIPIVPPAAFLAILQAGGEFL